MSKAYTTATRLDLQSTQPQLARTPFEAQLIDRALDLAIFEDLGSDGSDITSKSMSDKRVRATIYCKEKAVLAGLTLLPFVFAKIGQGVNVEVLKEDGLAVESLPCPVANIEGPASLVLAGERLALNLLQRLSGVATPSWGFVQLARTSGISVLDTRKTTPGLRVLERYAVRAAGGINHRFGLFDAVLIKDNHLSLEGGIAPAILAARNAHPNREIEVEAATLDQVRDAVHCRAERILLDNMTAEMVQQAVDIIAGSAFVEVSGGIKLNTISNYLIKGVDAISVGALTHSASNIDMSLEIEELI